MPMRDYSTLIYFVNTFKTDLENTGQNEPDYMAESALTSMEKQSCSPSDRTIKNILDFACSYEVVETRETGYVEMNLN